MNNILIIEDDPDIREVIRLLLENDGYTVAEAANGIGKILSQNRTYSFNFYLKS